MRRSMRSAMFGLAAVGLVAAVAPGLAAGIVVPTAANVPAAGQGVADVQGFEVCDIKWAISDADPAKVTEITFSIKRDSDAGACGTASSVATANATVRVQLQATSGTDGDFAECTTVVGAATCPLSGGASIDAADLEKVNIIAFDAV